MTTTKKYTIDQLRGAFGAGRAAAATKQTSGDRVRAHLDKLLGEIWNVANWPDRTEDDLRSGAPALRWSGLRFCGRLEALLHPFIDGRCRLSPMVLEMFSSTEEFIEYWVIWQAISCADEYAESVFAEPELARHARRLARYLRRTSPLVAKEALYTRASRVSVDSSRVA
jgi:hypothetical protein